MQLQEEMVCSYCIFLKYNTLDHQTYFPGINSKLAVGSGNPGYPLILPTSAVGLMHIETLFLDAVWRVIIFAGLQFAKKNLPAGNEVIHVGPLSVKSRLLSVFSQSPWLLYLAMNYGSILAPTPFISSWTIAIPKNPNRSCNSSTIPAIAILIFGMIQWRSSQLLKLKMATSGRTFQNKQTKKNLS